MNITLKREPSTDKGTFGVMLREDGTKLCLTCELPWNNNLVGKSCIPVGKYHCKPYTSEGPAPKYKDIWQLMDVPGRKLILIHNGNTIKDIRGCILVGRSFGMFNVDGKRLPGVTQSKLTLEQLRSELPREFTLTIK